MQTYTGIGSRQVPGAIYDMMVAMAAKLASEGWTLRSGGADGCDSAFEEGAGDGKAEIYIPWGGFNGRDKSPQVVCASRLRNYQEAQIIASQTHPAWDRCSRGAKALHTRNVYQILGRELDDPSQFVLCYAKPTTTGVSGGTNTAVQLAWKHDVRVFNLWDQSTIERVEWYLCT